MNLLIQKLEEYYRENGLEVTADEIQSTLEIKQRILVPDGFLNLVICVYGDQSDYRSFRFACYGLGRLTNPTDKDLFKINYFNENQEEMRMRLNENSEVYLSFDREFPEITSYDLGIDTMEKALECVSTFAIYIKRNYQLLKNVIRCLK